MKCKVTSSCTVAASRFTASLRLQWNMSCISSCQFPSPWLIISFNDALRGRQVNLDEELGQQPTDSTLVSQVDRIAFSSPSRCPVEEWLMKPRWLQATKKHSVLRFYNVIRVSDVFYSEGTSCWSHSVLQLVDRVQRKTEINHINLKQRELYLELFFQCQPKRTATTPPVHS